jgi:hypothetical protein
VRVWESAHITYNQSTSVFDKAFHSAMARMSLISTPFLLLFAGLCFCKGIK